MDYVVHKLPTTNKACIHFGSHDHLVSINDYHESIVISKALVKVEVEKNPRATMSIIALVANITFLSRKLFSSNEPTTIKLQGTQFHGLMDRFSTLSSSNIKNLVLGFRHGNFRHGPLDNFFN
jgi:hypothetical protein